MLTTVKAGPYTITGVSIAGIHTSLYVRELGVLFDVGIALRSCAGAEHVFLSHGHADHSGALVTLLGIRGLLGMRPPRVYLPAELASSTRQALALLGQHQRRPFELETESMQPGDERVLRPDLSVRAFRTHHTGPSLGYQFFSRVQKLEPQYLALSGQENRRAPQTRRQPISSRGAARARLRHRHPDPGRRDHAIAARDPRPDPRVLFPGRAQAHFNDTRRRSHPSRRAASRGLTPSATK